MSSESTIASSASVEASDSGEHLSIPGFALAVRYPTVTSTMDVAKEWLSHISAASLPALFVADQQTSGRGRQGRVWENPREARQNPSLLRDAIFGHCAIFELRKNPQCIAADTSAVFSQLKNCTATKPRVSHDGQVLPRLPSIPKECTALMVTFLFTCSRPIVELAGYSLACGVAIAQVLHPARVELKWPNDLMIRNQEEEQRARKLGGLLVEILPFGDSHVVSLGVGINVLNSPAGVPHAISLREAGLAETSVSDVLAKISEALLLAHGSFMQDGFAPFKEEWLAHSIFRAGSSATTVSVDLGHEELHGAFQGVSDTGSLLLKEQNSEVVREVHSGHVLAWRDC